MSNTNDTNGTTTNGTAAATGDPRPRLEPYCGQRIRVSGLLGKSKIWSDYHTRSSYKTLCLHHVEKDGQVLAGHVWVHHADDILAVRPEQYQRLTCTAIVREYRRGGSTHQPPTVSYCLDAPTDIELVPRVVAASVPAMSASTPAPTPAAVEQSIELLGTRLPVRACPKCGTLISIRDKSHECGWTADGKRPPPRKRCPDCGKLLHSARRRCDCGHSFGTSPKNNTTSATTGTPARIGWRYNCPGCGNFIHAAALSCDECGWCKGQPVEPVNTCTSGGQAPAVEPGNIVQLRTGGPRMVVERAGPDGVLCAWFDKCKLKRETFAAESLRTPAD